MIVVGLDPSLTSCGIAILRDGTPILLTSIGHASPNGKSYAHRSDRIVSQCRAVVQAIQRHPQQQGAYQRIDLAVMEGPAYGENLPSNHDRAGLWWGLFSALRAKRVPVAVVPPATAKKWCTGRGNAIKRDVLDTVRGWWPNTAIRNNDIADAAVAAAMGALWLGETLPFTRARHRIGLESVAWPETVTA